MRQWRGLAHFLRASCPYTSNILSGTELIKAMTVSLQVQCSWLQVEHDSLAATGIGDSSLKKPSHGVSVVCAKRLK